MKIITLLVLALIFSPISHAKTNQKLLSKLEDKYNKLPFDPKKTKIDNNYLGAYYPKVAEAAMNAPVKDEYETTENFKKRFNKWQKTPFIGSLTPNDLMAIEISKDSVITAYDADNTLMTIYPSQTNLVLKQVKSGSNKKGITRMGIPFTYSTEFIREAIIENNCSLFTYGCQNLALTFNIPSNEAKQQKWRFFAIGHLKEPFYFQNETIHEPRLDEPYLTITETHKLHMDIYQLWIYSITQQEIIAKLEITKRADLPDEIESLFYDNVDNIPSEPITQQQEQIEESTVESSKCTPEKKEQQRNGQIPWPLPCTDKEMDSF